jgi:hypothetical protein
MAEQAQEIICKQSSTRHYYELNNSVGTWARFFKAAFPAFKVKWIIIPQRMHRLKLKLTIMYPNRCLAGIQYISILKENEDIPAFVEKLADLERLCQLHVHKCKYCAGH